ncbi:MAG: nuclear transport factor 2 family protein [Anaerolineae bacterium]|nr:nuclear transport factor 2 family protein [Anaerolineae bacterium]
MTPEEFMQAYEQATNTHDPARVAALVDKDAVYWFNDGSFLGIDAIQGALAKTWDFIQDETYRIADVRWIAQGETTAVCIYTFHWRGLVNGQVAEGNGRGTSVLRKTDGEWKVVHEHLSPQPRSNNS